MTETNDLKKSMTLREISQKYHIQWTAIYQSAKAGKYPTHRRGRSLCVYEEDYIDFMAHKYDRTRSTFNGKPLYGEGEISVPQCAKLFGVPPVDIYYRVHKGWINHERRGNSIVLNYEECLQFFAGKSKNQLELINDQGI